MIFKNWNKKAAESEPVISLWWIFIIGVIGGFIVLGVVIYYSTDINTNSAEASILINKLSDCIVNNGKLNENFLNQGFDVVFECGLDNKMFGLESFLYFNISIYDNDILIKEFVNGSRIFEKDCRINSKIESKNFPSCVNERYFVRNKDKIIRIDILGGSNQIGSKIPLK
jgi:hypothetical protein